MNDMDLTIYYSKDNVLDARRPGSLSAPEVNAFNPAGGIRAARPFC